MKRTPLSVVVVNDGPLTLIGLQHMLAPFRDRVVVCGTYTSAGDVVDIALFDLFGKDRVDLAWVSDLVADPRHRHTALFTARQLPDLTRHLLDRGVRGCLSKCLPAADLVDALEQVGTGETVILSEPGLPSDLPWPGRELGLTRREGELLSMVVQGMRTDEIAQALFISPNTVKDTFKRIFRKLGVRSRAEAVAAAMGQAGPGRPH